MTPLKALIKKWRNNNKFKFHLERNLYYKFNKKKTIKMKKTMKGTIIMLYSVKLIIFDMINDA